MTYAESLPFPVGTPFFRGYCDRDKTIPVPPMLFRGEPILLASEAWNVIDVEYDNQIKDALADLFESLDCPLSEPLEENPEQPRRICAEMEAVAAWDILKPMNLRYSEVGELVLIVETLWIGLRSMMNELANAQDAQRFFQKKIVDAVQWKGGDA